MEAITCTFTPWNGAKKDNCVGFFFLFDSLDSDVEAYIGTYYIIAVAAVRTYKTVDKRKHRPSLWGTDRLRGNTTTTRRENVPYECPCRWQFKAILFLNLPGFVNINKRKKLMIR